MSTNYYLEVPGCEHPCPHCNHLESLHIGKNMTMFEAHADSPYGPLESWQQYKAVIAQVGKVLSEYGYWMSADEFIAAVEAEPAVARGRQYRWLIEHGCNMHLDYLDADGFSFTRTEFT